MPSPHPLTGLLSPDSILALAGRTWFARGMHYLTGGRVHDLRDEDGVVTATVSGTEEYQVRLTAQGGQLVHYCSCPAAEGSRFCKHLVAVAAGWMTLRDGSSPWLSMADAPLPVDVETLVVDEAYVMKRTAHLQPAAPPAPDVRAFLDGRSHADLVALLIEFAGKHASVRRTLELRAIAAQDDAALVEGLRRVVARTFRSPGFLTTDRAASFLARAGEVVGELERLVPRAPGAMVELVEEALVRIERLADDVDDGEGGSLYLIERLTDLHLRACEAARPEPGALARRLVWHAAESEYSVFVHAATEYACVLGDEGLAAYRETAEALWDAYPPLGPGQRSTDGRRHRLASMMERLAHASGSLEALIDVLRRDLGDARGFLRVAEAYRDAGDLLSAVQWAERGIAELPRTGDRCLRTFLADTYHDLGRHDDAMAVVWLDFAEQPSLDGYGTLKSNARRVAGAWPAWRRRAIDALRAHADERHREADRGRRGTGARPDYSELVRVLLSEDLVDQAWEAAEEGECFEALRFELARRREGSHPAEAIPHYRRHIEESLAHGRYDEAVRHLLRLRDVWQRAAGHPYEYAAFLAELRATHSRKRNFQKLLAAAGLS